MEYSNEYVERLQEVSDILMIAAEQALSIIDKDRIALVDSDAACKKLNDALAMFHGLNRDFDNT